MEFDISRFAKRSSTKPVSTSPKLKRQDEESCVVFGMPKEATAMGSAAEILPLDRIAAGILCAAA